jgi:hypothetical protein
MLIQNNRETFSLTNFAKDIAPKTKTALEIAFLIDRVVILNCIIFMIQIQSIAQMINFLNMTI